LVVAFGEGLTGRPLGSISVARTVKDGLLATASRDPQHLALDARRGGCRLAGKTRVGSGTLHRHSMRS